jgi:hypothetical protein
MAHNEQVRPGEPEVRKYLADSWHEFYNSYVRVALDGDEAFGKYAHDALHPRLHALQSGAAVAFTRDDLPPDHPEKAGRSDDPMWIDERNVIHVGRRR